MRDNRSFRSDSGKELCRRSAAEERTTVEEDVVALRLHALLHACDSLTGFAETDWRQILGSLPVNTHDYLFLSNWLNNTVQLMRIAEYGAARYQLRIVRARLLSILDAWQRMPAALSSIEAPTVQLVR